MNKGVFKKNKNIQLFLSEKEVPLSNKRIYEIVDISLAKELDDCGKTQAQYLSSLFERKIRWLFERHLGNSYKLPRF